MVVGAILLRQDEGSGGAMMLLTYVSRDSKHCVFRRYSNEPEIDWRKDMNDEIINAQRAKEQQLDGILGGVRRQFYWEDGERSVAHSKSG